jgi:hypothetical protein
VAVAQLGFTHALGCVLLLTGRHRVFVWPIPWREVLDVNSRDSWARIVY